MKYTRYACRSKPDRRSASTRCPHRRYTASLSPDLQFHLTKRYSTCGHHPTELPKHRFTTQPVINTCEVNSRWRRYQITVYKYVLNQQNCRAVEANTLVFLVTRITHQTGKAEPSLPHIPAQLPSALEGPQLVCNRGENLLWPLFGLH